MDVLLPGIKANLMQRTFGQTKMYTLIQKQHKVMKVDKKAIVCNKTIILWNANIMSSMNYSQ